MALFAVAYITSVVIQRKFPYRGENDLLLKNAFRAEELNRKIVEDMDSGILVIDSEWRVQLINDSAAVMLGQSKVREKATLAELSAELQQAFLAWKTTPLAGTKPFRNQRNDAELLPHFSALGMHGTLIHLEDHGAIAQQVQQLKLASLGSLTASIAHEIRNPLAAISHSIQLVSENDQVDSGDRKMLAIAERHCTRINRIIEDILQLSRREKNNPETIAVSPYLAEFGQKFRDSALDRSFTLTIRCAEDEQITFDKSHLEQILSNLCMNALTHNPDKAELHIDIQAQTTEPRGHLCITVADNGQGIEEHIADDIFEPFYTTKHGGTGLGLFIIRELCEINNAQISYSANDNGACFILLIANRVT